jgi:serine/threonine-protein kinase SRPK3
MAHTEPPGFAGTYCAPLSVHYLHLLTQLTHSDRAHKHITLKVGTPEALEGELKALRHFATIKTDHAGSLLIRQILDDFKIDSKHGVFHGVVHPPLAIPINAFRRMLPEQALPVDFLKQVLMHLFLSVDFLHTEAKVIHTGKAAARQERTLAYDFLISDIQESNILLGMNEKTTEQDLDKYEQDELKYPCARKIDGDRVIYASRKLFPSVYSFGRPVLCDFGEARFGEYDNMVDIQPYQYRAPEVIFDMPWDNKVDIWSVGVMVRPRVV